MRQALLHLHLRPSLSDFCSLHLQHGAGTMPLRGSAAGLVLPVSLSVFLDHSSHCAWSLLVLLPLR